MEHILISPGKIKLIMTKLDLDKYELDCEAMDSGDSMARKAFRELLRDVGRETGFKADDDKLFVQLYPSKDGGAEMYITRLSPKYSSEADPSKTVKRIYVCSFETLDALLSCCAGICASNDGGTSQVNGSAWHGGGKYYILAEQTVSYRHALRGAEVPLIAIVGSYGRVLTASSAAAYVKEHCTCFCGGNAIETLSKLAQ